MGAAVGSPPAAASVSSPNGIVTMANGQGSAAAASAGGIAGTNTLGLAEGALARRWPADWFTRYDKPVARILRSGTALAQWSAVPAPAERAVVVNESSAQPYPVRWPELIGQPLPPAAASTQVMGAPPARTARP